MLKLKIKNQQFHQGPKHLYYWLSKMELQKHSELRTLWLLFYQASHLIPSSFLPVLPRSCQGKQQVWGHQKEGSTPTE